MGSNIMIKTEVLKKYLEEHGVSEKELADKIGVAHSTVNRVINGRRGPGGKFISGLLRNFNDIEFEDVFYFQDSLPKGNEKKQRQIV